MKHQHTLFTILGCFSNARTSRCPITRLSLTAALIFVGSITAQGQDDTNWVTSVTEGFFDVAENWSNGAPDSTKRINFNIADSATVTLRGNATVAAARFWSDSTSPAPVDNLSVLTLDLASYQLNVNDLATDSFRPPQTNGTTRRLILLGEQDDDGDNLGILNSGNIFTYVGHTGNSSQGRFELIIGFGATYRSNGSFAVQWGNTTTGSALVDVQAGGRLELTGSNANRDFRIAVSTNNNAELRVSGGYVSHAGTYLRIAEGAGSKGYLNILEGGTFNSAGNIRVGSGSGGEGYVLVDGTGSTLAAAGLYVGGTEVNGFGMGTATFSDGGSGTVNELLVYFTPRDPDTATTYGTLIFDGGSLHVNNTATFQENSLLNVTINGVGGPAVLSADVLNIDGAILELALGSGFNGNIDDVIYLLEYRSELNGTFFGLDEGAIFSIGDSEHLFQISYLMAEGSMIGLTIVPEPGNIAAILGAVALLVLIRRNRRNS